MKITDRAGLGPETTGEAVIFAPEKCHETTSLNSEQSGKIVICLAPVGREFISKALFLGLAGLVLPSIHYRDLASFSGGNEMTIVLIKRFGVETLTEEEQKEFHHWNNKHVKISKDNNFYALETTT